MQNFLLTNHGERLKAFPLLFHILSPLSALISGVIYEFISGAIVAIDVKSEKPETIALWNAPHESVYHYELTEVKGKLEVIDYRKWVSGYLDLWILEQTPQRKGERHIIGIPSIWNVIKPIFVSTFMACDGEVVFVVVLKSHACLCCDFTRKSWRELQIMGLPKENYIKGIYSYVESLVPLGFCNSMVSESTFLDIHKCHSGGTKFLLHGEGVYYSAKEKKDGKASASVLQVDRFNNPYNGNPAYSRLNCVNGLFCG
ncbi:hypothetical protein H5410_003930 [Solanum commersonii]|uniref:F-box associated beta-propeller type 3 domain-containing protein n=1 Tax=Solanum commersonii TaxID=4109 RepID=A0A9J6B605_SOLCO|nr:hypothetical protein H5410_003930 [Solanum commersonii]